MTRLAAVPELHTIGPGHRRALAAVALGTVAAIALTLNHYGFTANGLGWSAVQVLLGFIAGWDILTRRILNVVVLPASVIVIALRAAFEPSAVPEILVAGAVAFVVFVVLAVVGSGLGMGDIKLAGLLGLLLGRAALGALLAGVIAGGVAAALLLASGRAGRKSLFAYGPYLALGGAVWILVGSPPSLF
jgi:leader peptidase (prepilin peptidase)/N-methyltransferase